MDVSIAYQGGGAKIVELMAAAEACRKVERERKDFTVIRVAGASAGAIAAAMYATSCDINSIVSNHEKLRTLVAKYFNPGRANRGNIVWRLAWGKSVFDETDLRSAIWELFNLGGVDASTAIQGLVREGVGLRILRSDIHSHEPLTATESSDALLLDALVDSCAIPFAFRVPRPGTNAHLLDGGLFQNLPAWEAARGLKPGQEVLGFSFEKGPVTRVENVSLGRYAAAILESLLSERLRDATMQIKEANIIRLPIKRGTFEFSKMFGENFVQTFTDGVGSSAEAITQWIKDTRTYDEPDWFSDHPKDVAEQARRTNNDILRFFEEIGEYPINAELVHHEVVFQSSINPKSPDVYNLHIVLDGDLNPGLQFMRFWFYNSSAGPLKRATVEVRDRSRRRRKVMLLPIRHQPGEQSRSSLLCLDRPLQPGERITILKSEQSFQGMIEYMRDGIGYETLTMGPGKFAKELRITVHFPEADKPRHVRDASRDFPVELAKLEEEIGSQLRTTSRKSRKGRTGWVSHINAARPKAKSNEPLFIKVVYDKGSV